MDDDWDMGEKSMRMWLDKVLSPGQTCFYEYDFGTTTDLRLKVVSERQAATKGNATQALPRNVPPVLLSEECGKPATSASSQSSFAAKRWRRDDCATPQQSGEWSV